ncbi:MAG: VOC family protein [Alphaproteobacteria bacterium]|nr:VOC family protein [Alphaproteobacteria bacterium]
MPRVIHFENLAKNTATATKFYKDALGWKINAWEMPGQTYWMASTGAKTEVGIDGGIMDAGRLGQPVINTVEVKAFKSAQAKIEKAGGRLARAPTTFPTSACTVTSPDPDGILFGVLQPPKAGAVQTSAAPARKSRPAAKKRTARKAAKPKTRKPAFKRGKAKR